MHCVDDPLILLKPFWAEKRTDLPPSPSDVYTDREAFLTSVATWIQTRLSAGTNRMQPVFHAVRDAEEAFPGSGVYTTSELSAMAGLCTPNSAVAAVTR